MMMTEQIVCRERCQGNYAEEHIRFGRAADVSVLYAALERLAERHRSVRLTSLGESVEGRAIPLITLGEDRTKPAVCYVGGLCGTDAISPAVLLRFVSDYADFLEAGRRMYAVNLPLLYASRVIAVIPMLNPDGYVIRKDGADDSPIADRLREQCGGDFRAWRGNARGVDLSRSFFADPPEAEVGALTGFLRLMEGGGDAFGKIGMLIELNGEGDGVRYTADGNEPPRSRTIARLLSRMTDQPRAEENVTEGGAADYALREGKIPAFLCGCAPAGDDTRFSETDRYLAPYAAFREALFSAPLLI